MNKYHTALVGAIAGARRRTVAGPAFRSSAKAIRSGSYISIPKPTGVVADDYLIALIEQDAVVRTFTPPAGWVSLYRVSKATGDTQTAEVYGYKASSSEPSTYDFGISNVNNGQGIICAYSGVNTTTAQDCTGTGTSATGGSSPVTVTALSITTVTANSLVIWLATGDVAAIGLTRSFTAPSDFTLRENYAGIEWCVAGVADLAFAAGSTGNKSGTLTLSSSTSGYIAFLMALRPA